MFTPLLHCENTLPLPKKKKKKKNSKDLIIVAESIQYRTFRSEDLLQLVKSTPFLQFNTWIETSCTV